MGAELQVKLLRVLEAKTLRRVGGSQDLASTCGSSRPRTAIRRRRSATGKLREDLYYRLNVFPIACRRCPSGATTSRCSPSTSASRSRSRRRRASRAGIREALEMLQHYDWPGNVRELRNVVHRAYVMTEGDTIQPGVVESLPAPGRESRAPRPREARGDQARRRYPRRSPESGASGTSFAVLLERGPQGRPGKEEGKSCFGPSSSYCSILWVLGLVSGYTLSGFIHILLVIAVVVLIINLIQGRRVV